MSVWDQAEAIYSEEYCPRTLAEDFRLHVENEYGCVIKLPHVIALARPVSSNAPESMIVDPRFEFNEHESDCWHIYLLVGDAGAAWDYLPFELDWMSYERRNVLRIAPFCRMKALLSHDLRPTIQSKSKSISHLLQGWGRFVCRGGRTTSSAGNPACDRKDQRFQFR